MASDKKVPSISEWFQNRNVMVTGGTGFMGKVLLAKLLTGCPNIGNVYVVIRDKKGVPAETRLVYLLKVCIKYCFYVNFTFFIYLLQVKFFMFRSANV